MDEENLAEQIFKKWADVKIVAHDLCGVQDTEPPKGSIFEKLKYLKPAPHRPWHAPAKKPVKVKEPRVHEPLSLTLVDLKKSPSLLDIMRMEDK